MSSESVSGNSAAGKRLLPIALAVLGVIALVIAVLYFADASVLPHFMIAKSQIGKSGAHGKRGAVMIVAALILGAGAWWTNKKAAAAS